MDLPDSLAVPRNHDIVTLVIRDHEALRRSLDSVKSGESGGLEEGFWQSGYELVRHEVAEEQVLYPALRECGSLAVEVTGRALAQQADVERLLADLEKAGRANDAFEQALDALKSSVQSHAAFEEDQVLSLVVDHFSDEIRFELGDRYAQAKKVAPTHPHPHLTGHLAMSVAGIVDRVRDAVVGSRPRPNRSAGPNAQADHVGSS